MTIECPDIVIDSPSPEVAHQEAGKYYDWLEPAFRARNDMPEREEWAKLILEGNLCFVRVWVDAEFKAVAVAQVNDGLEREVVIAGLVGTDPEKWLKPLSDTFDKMAKELGAKWVVLHGRPGWAKILRGEGYKPLQITLRKRVGATNGRN